MLGKELDDLSDIKGEQPTEQKTENGEPLFETKDLCSDAGIKPFDFYIKKGEVNGFTGLLGSGRSECVRAIFGADRVIGGTVKRTASRSRSISLWMLCVVESAICRRIVSVTVS